MPLTLDAWSVGEKLREWTEGKGPAEVADIFPNSIYIRTSDSELVSITRKGARSPVNVNLSDSGPSFEGLVRRGEKANLGSETLMFQSLSVRLNGPTYASSFVGTEIDVSKVLPMKGSLRHVASMLQVFDLKESLLDREGKAFGLYRGFVRDVFIKPLVFDGSVFLERAGPMLGTGSGFTPSFDDFAAGFLCMLNAGRKLTGMRPLILGRELVEKRTTWASSRLLDYMQRGLMDELVEGVVRHFYGGEEDDFVYSLESVVGRGHSSGLDMSVGMLMACATIFAIIHHDSTAADIAARLGF